VHAQDRNITASTTYTIDEPKHSTSSNSLTGSPDTGGPSFSSNLNTNSNHLETATSDSPVDPENGQSRKHRLPAPENTPPTPPKNPYLLPSPTSRQKLYDNLKRAMSIKPPLNPPILIDYHESYPQFQSTRSYNLIIESAICHTHFGTAQWLFDAMIRAVILQNEHTHRLFIRWLVRTGRWEQAWALATGLTPEKALDKPLRRGQPPIVTKIPCGVWQELLHTIQRSGLRRPRNFRRRIGEVKPDKLLPPLEFIKDPAPGTEACLRRQRLLACIRPIMEHDKWLGPKVMKGFIYPIVRTGLTAEAIEITKTYFSSLPVEISRKDAAQCLDIIHLLLSTDMTNGLFSLVANRKLLLSLLEAHTSLRPSPKTLFLFLSPLQRMKKCGTVAFKVLKEFERSWGSEVINVNVRQRVIRLAEKEGRIDLKQAMLNGPTTTRSSRRRRTSGSRRVSTALVSCTRPIPDREAFADTKGHNGLGDMLTT
jgi:hypothetical protein